MNEAAWRFYVGPLNDRFTHWDEAAFQTLSAELVKRGFTLTATPDDSTKRAVFTRPDSSKIAISSTGSLLLYDKSDRFLSLSTALKESLQIVGHPREDAVSHTDSAKVWCLVM